MIYPQKLSSAKGDKIIKILALVSTFIAILLVVINKLTTPNIHWAALANAGIIYTWITVIYSIKRNINIAGHVLLQTIAISILNLYIDYQLGFYMWSLSISIPIMIIVSNITMLVLTIVTHKKYIKYAIYQLIILIFSMLPVVLISEDIVQFKVLSIIAVGISILNLILTLILCANAVKDAVVRKFHM